MQGAIQNYLRTKPCYMNDTINVFFCFFFLSKTVTVFISTISISYKDTCLMSKGDGYQTMLKTVTL